MAGRSHPTPRILRWKPNIKWSKDRGKEPQSLTPKVDFPWLWGCENEGNEAARVDFPDCADFYGGRWNDLHYALAVKQATRVANSRRGH